MALWERELPATASRVGEDAAAFSKPAQSKCLTKSVAACLDLLHASVQTGPAGRWTGGDAGEGEGADVTGEGDARTRVESLNRTNSRLLPLTLRTSTLPFTHTTTQSRQCPPRPASAPHDMSEHVPKASRVAAKKNKKTHNRPKNVALQRRGNPAAARDTSPPDVLQMFCMCDVVRL